MAYFSVTLDRTERPELNSKGHSVSSAPDQSRLRNGLYFMPVYPGAQTSPLRSMTSGQNVKSSGNAKLSLQELLL